jgi:hypothetical protein
MRQGRSQLLLWLAILGNLAEGAKLQQLCTVDPMATPDQPLNPPTRLQSELIVCFVVSNRRTIEFPRVLLSCNRKRTPANLAQRAASILMPGFFTEPSGSCHRRSSPSQPS